ncbi:MAG: (2Fe-2S)-binding protein [Burkholderiales bacterium]
MILCQCSGVSDATVARLIKEGAATLGAITRRCGAGRYCPPCRNAITSMLGRAANPSRYDESRSASSCAESCLDGSLAIAPLGNIEG